MEKNIGHCPWRKGWRYQCDWDNDAINKYCGVCEWPQSWNQGGIWSLVGPCLHRIMLVPINDRKLCQLCVSTFLTAVTFCMSPFVWGTLLRSASCVINPKQLGSYMLRRPSSLLDRALQTANKKEDISESYSWRMLLECFPSRQPIKEQEICSLRS